MEAPKTYEQQSPSKLQNIITMDCRGLEFVEFKADVSSILPTIPYLMEIFVVKSQSNI